MNSTILLLLAFISFIIYKIVSSYKPHPYLKDLKHPPLFKFQWSIISGDSQLDRWRRFSYLGEYSMTRSFLSQWSVVVQDPALMREVYSKPDIFEKEILADEKPDSFFGRVVGKNIVMSNGELWKKHRKIVHPAFLSKTFSTEVFGNCANGMLDEWKLIDHKPIETHDWLQRLTLDVIGKAGFSFDFNSLHDKNSKWVQDYNQVLSAMQIPIYFLLPYLDTLARRYPKIFKTRAQQAKTAEEFHAMLHTIVEKRRKEIKENKDADREDLLTLMIKSTDGDNAFEMTSEELKSNLFIFFLAGHDTTSHSIGVVLYNLALKPECQERARQEVNAIMGDETEFRRIPTASEQKQFKYVDSVIKESLRLYPSVPFLPSKVTTQETELGGVKIPANTKVILNILGAQRNPRWWKNPLEFDPMRFFDDPNNESNSKFEAFARGSRACLGMNFSLMEQRIVIAMILRNYEWTISPDNIHHPQNGGLKVGAVGLMTMKPLELNFTRRF